MRRWISLALLVGLVLAGCGRGDANESAVQDSSGAGQSYFQAMDAWGENVGSRLSELERAKPTNDDPRQYAEYLQGRTDVLVELREELASIEPVAETVGVHADLLAGFQASADLNERIIEALGDASSVDAVLGGPLSAGIELVGGGLLLACGELIEMARSHQTYITLFC